MKNCAAAKKQFSYVQWDGIVGGTTKWKSGRQLGVYGTKDAQAVVQLRFGTFVLRLIARFGMPDLRLRNMSDTTHRQYPCIESACSRILFDSNWLFVAARVISLAERGPRSCQSALPGRRIAGSFMICLRL